jgi:uncharacterized membrane protein
MDEIILTLVGLAVAGLILACPVLAIVAYVRARRVDELSQRVARLESAVRSLASGAVAAPRPAPSPAVAPLAVAPAGVSAPPQIAKPILSPPAEAPVEAILVAGATTATEDWLGWEFLIGRKALGWIAVVVLIFATGFFLRYAFANRWIGPVGQIALGATAGVVLVAAGGRCQRTGRRVFAQMLAAAGIVLVYLATYSAFGFYHLIDQQTAGLFLFLVVVESALLALGFDAPAIAIMALVGGLLTPLLMHADRDQYVSLFLYLGMLNAGTIGLLLVRAWWGVGTLALAGTHALFWAWYFENYHPEKLPGALAFLAVMFLLYLTLSTGRSALTRRANWEDTLLVALNAILWSAAGYVLLNDDHHAWLGPLAIAMALVYAAFARVLLSLRADGRMLAASLAIAAAFIAVAIPLQAEAPWVSVGWAAEAAILWWFGLRIKAPVLRALAGVFAVAAVAQLLQYDTPFFAPYFPRGTFMPILNQTAASALVTTGLLAGGIVATRRFLTAIGPEERVFVGLATVACVLLVGWIVSVDIYTYFESQAFLQGEVRDWLRLGQMSLSAWWAVYATAVLFLGFRARRGLLRWTALALYGLTVVKVFLRDMAGLDEIYRIVAFFVLAVLLGVAAWLYQLVQPTADLERE